MLVKFKNSGRIVDTKAAEKFIQIGIAEGLEDVQKIEPKKATVVSNDEYKPKLAVKKKTVKRGRKPSGKRK